jgi:hypothetical protein
MSNNTPPRRTGVRRIAINGRFLDEVQTRLEDDRNGSVSHTSHPAEQHHAIEDEDGVTLRTPAMTALQLYHDGILPANREQSVELTVANRRLGAFFVQWLRGLSGRGFGDANNLRDAGRKARARQVLERLLIKDLRCLCAPLTASSKVPLLTPTIVPLRL